MNTITDILDNPCLEYLQIPKPHAAGIPHTGAFANMRTNPWDGYTDFNQVPIQTNLVDIADLQTAGWTVTPNNHWLRITPPNTGNHAITYLVHLVTDRYPSMITRMNKARELVEKGRVHADPTEAHCYLIHSLTEPNPHYQAYIDPGNRRNWHCKVLQPKNGSAPCPDLPRAPRLQHGPRCKHIMAAWIYLQLQKKEAPVPAGTSRSAERPQFQPHPTTPSAPRQVVARYQDGRPARYEDGTVIRYVGSTPVYLPPGVLS